MKKTIISFLFAAIVGLSCTGQKKSSSYSYSDDDGINKHSIVINDEKGSLELRYAGDISFTEDETALKSISGDGYLKYKRNGQKISVVNENGQLVYEVNGGDKKTTLTADETAFLSLAIKTMIAYGIGAKDRVQRIYKKGGSKAVLDEVVNLKSDYVKGIYLDYLLATDALTATDMTSLANNIRTLLDSDFEKGKLLSKFSAKYLADAATSAAYLNAIKSIGSDFEKANAVKKILGEPLSPGQFTDVLQVANSIESDFEKANVLKAVLNGNKISAAQFSEILKSTALIESDFEKANILKDILKKNQLPESQFDETLSVISSIGSDFEKANILKEVARKDITTAAHWIKLISQLEKVDSDFEKGNVLVDIAVKMPADENVKAAYMKAAKTISSDHDYGRVMRAVK